MSDEINFRLVLLFCILTFTASATNYYSDPSTAGSMTNSGAYDSPWADLSSIFAANKTFLAGDTIFLRTGNHGYTIIKGVNTDFVVIMPQPGEDPVIERIRISNAATTAADYWKLEHLTVQSEATGNMATPDYTLIEIYPYATHITISSCTITSNLNTTGWTRDDWRNRCNNGIFARGKLDANFLIEKNLIKNIAFGLTVSSSNTVVRENTVENFTHDATRVLGSNILFENNRVTDLIKVMTVAENHDDLFQSFVYPAGGTGQDTLKNDTIRNNIFIDITDTTRAFRGAVQGIGCFDGVFLNWIVENNIVITDHWHGISFYGAVDCKIVNNTVMDPYPYTPVDPFDNNVSDIGPTWIRIDKKATGPPSSGNLVKNNLLAGNVIIVSPDMGIASNNITMGAISNFSSYFQDVSDFGLPGNFDLHLKEGSPAIDSGDAADAPLTDYDGFNRPQGLTFDVGAYEYMVATGIEEHQVSREITIYPNPSTGIFHFDVGGFQTLENYQVEIFSAIGEKIFFTNQILPLTSNEIDLSNYPAGIYFVKIKGGKKAYTTKIVLE